MTTSPLELLKTADNLIGVASALGVRPKTLSYLLYVKKEPNYHSFELAKRGGGVRIIHAPNEEIKSIQRSLAALLYEATNEARGRNPAYARFSHGFEKRRGIATNADVHTAKKIVFNVDLKDFFPSINFGRVRGFFIKNSHFRLSEKAATVVAQIACYNGELPQGAPTSPIISNLILYDLDRRLSGHAAANGCYYSRYADDLTFSTRKKKLERSIGRRSFLFPDRWIVSRDLKSLVKQSGFSLNVQKTRGSYAGERQSVTGLTVNKVTNVPANYYKLVRAQINHLINNGYYFIELPKIGGKRKFRQTSNTSRLAGKLSHICNIKLRNEEFDPIKSSAGSMYRRLFYFERFADCRIPTILVEGPSDNIYLRSAIRARSSIFPEFYEATSSGKYNLKFFDSNPRKQLFTKLGEGTGAIALTIFQAHEYYCHAKYRGYTAPVIFVLDNDTGLDPINKQLKSLKLTPVSISDPSPFFHLFENVYIIKTPGATESCMETQFTQTLRDTKLDGVRELSLKNKWNPATHYGKMDFAHKVVRPAISTADFSGFDPLLQNIRECIADFRARR